MRVRNEKEKWRQVAFVSIASVLVSLAATHFVSPTGLSWTSFLPATVVPLIIAPVASLWAANIILALHRSNLRLEHLLLHDPMTGLLNRTAFFDFFDTEQNDTGGTVLMLDIDKFKSINDTFGHQVGDLVIKQAANVMSENTPQNGKVARLGGEEFAIFLPDRPINKGLALAEKIRSAFEVELREVGPDKVSCTISIGVDYRNDGEPIDTVLNRADKALYLAKNSGRNCVGTNEAIL
ncbi:MAG: GGDEF domain-containing protein [Roseibium sp.]|nr:GGDEF domain-containing protein [Roseibium sp.]